MPDTPPRPTDNAKRRHFRHLLTREGITVMPGGFSPLLARMCQDHGFESFFVAGSQVAAFLYGLPDNGIIGLREMAEHSRHITAHTDFPVIADGDTGYGNAVNVHFAVQEFIRAGLAGCQFEDQEAPKKSATQAGRRCIPADEAIGKIKAAVAARNALDPDFVICARCDVMGAEGSSFDAALARCKAYASEGGADLIWLNSVENREQIERACAEIPAPVMTIWGGKGPEPSIAELEGLGQKIAFFPVIASMFALHAAWAKLGEFRENGVEMLTRWRAETRRADTAGLLGQPQIRRIEEAYLPDDLKRDYDNTWGH